MTKVFQILNGMCHWDATQRHPSLDSAVGKYAPDIAFVKAPDYVFEGWGYDETQQGDARFIQPEPPEHWLYDPKTGTFYPDPNDPPEGWTPPVEPEDEAADMREALKILGVEPEEE